MVMVARSNRDLNLLGELSLHNYSSSTAVSFDEFGDRFDQGEDACHIVETSIELAHLVAEGVERQDDRVLISELGCNECQGFFIARPMTADGLPDW